MGSGRSPVPPPTPFLLLLGLLLTSHSPTVHALQQISERASSSGLPSPSSPQQSDPHLIHGSLSHSSFNSYTSPQQRAGNGLNLESVLKGRTRRIPTYTDSHSKDQASTTISELPPLDDVQVTNRTNMNFPRGLEAAAQLWEETYERGYDPSPYGQQKNQNAKGSMQPKRFQEMNKPAWFQKPARTELSVGIGNGRRAFASGLGYDDVQQGDSDSLVIITSIDVPDLVTVGEDVNLTCNFKLLDNKQKLYTLNWWRGPDQFYTYKENKHTPKSSYLFKGIAVDERRSTASSVMLTNVSEDTSGKYKCEAMAEGPAFKTAIKMRDMRVIVPPETVRIKTLWDDALVQPHLYRIEERVELNCTATGAKPRAQLTWQINDHSMNAMDSFPFPDYEDQNGRVTSSIGLKFVAPSHFSGPQAKVTCTADIEGHRVHDTTTLLLDSASSAAFNHMFARAAGREVALRWLLFATLAGHWLLRPL